MPLVSRVMQMEFQSTSPVWGMTAKAYKKRALFCIFALNILVFGEIDPDF